MINTIREQDLQRASDRSRCAAATAFELSDQVTGQKRDLAFRWICTRLLERSLTNVPVGTAGGYESGLHDTPPFAAFGGSYR